MKEMVAEKGQRERVSEKECVREETEIERELRELEEGEREMRGVIDRLG